MTPSELAIKWRAYDDDEYRRRVRNVPKKPTAASSKPVELGSSRTAARIRPVPRAAAATVVVGRRRADRVGDARIRVPAGLAGGRRIAGQQKGPPRSSLAGYRRRGAELEGSGLRVTQGAW